MKRHALLLFLLASLFIACQDEPEGQGFKPGSIKILKEVNKNGDYRYRGDLVKAVSWEDAKGQNTFVMSARPKFQISEELYRKRFYAYHYVQTPDTLLRIHYMTDATDSCICDCEVSLVDGKIHIDDLNGDGIAELWFAYYLDNRCDVSPVEMGMALWSNGKQLLLHGRVPPPENDQWKEPLPEPDVDPASTLTDMNLRTKARALWEEFK